MGVASRAGKTLKSAANALLERGVPRGPVSCSRGRRTMMVCGCSPSLACAVDHRPGRLVEMPSGNGEFGDPAGSGDTGPGDTGHALWQVELFEEQDVSDGWVPFEVTTLDVAQFAGQTVQIKADSRPNGNGTMSVWLDSLRLEARCPR